ncbi:MAG: hypothetical protein AB1714_10300 [Acidobacteriota bacterium]
MKTLSRVSAMALAAAVVAALTFTMTTAAQEEKKAEGLPEHMPLLQSTDTNGDGKISHEELMGGREGWFARIEKDTDGKITLEEFVAYQTAQFKVADGADQDGIVSVEEIEAFFVGPEHKVGKAAKDKAKSGAKPAAGSSTFSKMDLNADSSICAVEYVIFWDEVFTRMDANNDGKVTTDEWVARQNNLHKHLDADKDGAVTKEEMKSAPPMGEPAK